MNSYAITPPPLSLSFSPIDLWLIHLKWGPPYKINRSRINGSHVFTLVTNGWGGAQRDGCLAHDRLGDVKTHTTTHVLCFTNRIDSYNNKQSKVTIRS